MHWSDSLVTALDELPVKGKRRKTTRKREVLVLVISDEELLQVVLKVSSRPTCSVLPDRGCVTHPVVTLKSNFFCPTN